MDHIHKMLCFGVMQLFQFPLTAAGGSLCELATLRFASLAINNAMFRFLHQLLIDSGDF